MGYNICCLKDSDIKQNYNLWIKTLNNKIRESVQKLRRHLIRTRYFTLFWIRGGEKIGRPTAFIDFFVSKI